MKQFSVLLAMLLLFGVLPLSFFPSSSPAAEQQTGSEGAPGKSQTFRGEKGADIVLLIDSSGSMRKTDPRNNRKVAAKLFISLLGSDDRIGIVSFGDSAKLLLPLTRNSKENRTKFAGAINRISSKEFSTNIYEGVKKGYDELKALERKKKVLLLMSDGKLTLGSKEKEEAALKDLTALFPELGKSGITLSTIAFTELSDIQFLEDLAKSGGGFFKLALTDQDLHLIFASMFEKINSPDTVPFEGDSFAIDKDIKEAIVFISKKPGTTTTLTDPSGKKSTPAKFGKNIQWYEAKLFDLITVQSPDPGKWKVNLSTKEGNRVFVLTNLSLKSSFDKNFVNKNEKVRVNVWLEREGGMLQEKDILDQIAFSADLALTGSEGKSSKITLQPGAPTSFEFAAPEKGDYTLTLLAEGKTFKRTKIIQFRAVEPGTAPQVAGSHPAGAVHKKTAEPVTAWTSALIKFGIVNGVLLLAAGVVFLAKKLKQKGNSRKEKKKRRALE